MRRISKSEWYRIGGFRNSKCFRRGTPDGWTYWVTIW